MKKVILSALMAMAIGTVASADVKNVELTPYVGMFEGGKAISGLKVGAGIGEDWYFNVDGGVRENYPGASGQDWQVFVGMEKGLFQMAGIEGRLGIGGGHVSTDHAGNSVFGDVVDKSYGRISYATLYSVNKNDAVRLDLNTNFRSGDAEFSATIGYSISFGGDKDLTPRSVFGSTETGTITTVSSEQAPETQPQAMQQ
ncbi:MAG: hypothetical protein M1300_05695 [Epsilonproteobacteria bacterium]|nr:hypothetical protein [Campylobacterota bacterium]